jgi:Zn-finger nucleic acid-binding protein
MTVTSSLPCPRCRLALVEMRIGGVETDVCEHCGGLWLDRHEPARFERPEQVFGDALVAHLQQFPTVLLDHSVRLQCPRHGDVTMLRRPYSARASVEVDVCPQCGGVWLDADELAEIRQRLAAAPRGGEA